MRFFKALPILFLSVNSAAVPPNDGAFPVTTLAEKAIGDSRLINGRSGFVYSINIINQCTATLPIAADVFVNAAAKLGGLMTSSGSLSGLMSDTCETASSALVLAYGTVSNSFNAVPAEDYPDIFAAMGQFVSDIGSPTNIDFSLQISGVTFANLFYRSKRVDGGIGKRADTCLPPALQNSNYPPYSCLA